jgi:hypothetical protein
MTKYKILNVRDISKLFDFKYIEPIKGSIYKSFIFEIGNYIATISEYKFINIWEKDTVITVSQKDNTINIWKKDDILNLKEDRNLVKQFLNNKDEIVSLIPYKDNQLISVSKNGMVRFFNLDSGLEIQSFISTKFEKQPDKIGPEWSTFIHYCFQVSNTYKSDLDILYLLYDEGTIISFDLNNNNYESRFVLDKFQRYISIKDNIVMYEKEKNKKVFIYDLISKKEVFIEFKNRKNNYPKNFVKVSDNLIVYHTDTKIVLFDIDSGSIIHTFEEENIKSLEKPLKIDENRVIFFDKIENWIIECNIKDKVIDYAYINTKNIDYWYKIDNNLLIFDTDNCFSIVDLDTWKVTNQKHESDFNKYSYGDLELVNENKILFTKDAKSYLLDLENNTIIKELKSDCIISVDKELLLYKEQDKIIVFNTILNKEIKSFTPKFIPVKIYKVSSTTIAYSSKDKIIFFDIQSNSEEVLEFKDLKNNLISEEITRIMYINENEIVIISDSNTFFTIYDFISKKELVSFVVRDGKNIKKIIHNENLILIYDLDDFKIIDLTEIDKYLINIDSLD